MTQEQIKVKPIVENPIEDTTKSRTYTINDLTENSRNWIRWVQNDYWNIQWINIRFEWFADNDFVNRVNRLSNHFWISLYEWTKKKNTLELMKELNKKVPKWPNVDRSTFTPEMNEVYQLKDMMILYRLVMKWKQIKDKWKEDTTYEVKFWKKNWNPITVNWHLWEDLYKYLKYNWWII